MNAEAELKRLIAECTTQSPLSDALCDSKLPFYVRNGSHRHAMETLDRAIHHHEDIENDPNYVSFMEMLALVLYRGENLLQADTALDKIKNHARTNGLELSPLALALDKSLHESPLYRLQHTMEHAGIDFEP